MKNALAVPPVATLWIGPGQLFIWSIVSHSPRRVIQLSLNFNNLS